MQPIVELKELDSIVEIDLEDLDRRISTEPSDMSSAEFWYDAGRNVSGSQECYGAMRAMPSFNQTLRR